MCPIACGYHVRMSCTAYGYLWLLSATPQFILAFAINQAGSVLHLLLLGGENPALAEPLCNGISFVFTALTARALGETTRIHPCTCQRLERQHLGALTHAHSSHGPASRYARWNCSGSNWMWSMHSRQFVAAEAQGSVQSGEPLGSMWANRLAYSCGVGTSGQAGYEQVGPLRYTTDPSEQVCGVGSQIGASTGCSSMGVGLTMPSSGGILSGKIVPSGQMKSQCGPVRPTHVPSGH